LVRAHMWFNIAAAQGNDRGRTLRDVTATEMNGLQLAEAQRLAVEQVKVKSR